MASSFSIVFLYIFYGRQCLHFSLDLFPADNGNYLGDYRPDWGSMSFLIDFLRPTASEGPSWYSVLKKAGGGCNDLLYSGHMLVAVLTAMAWTVSPLYLLISNIRSHDNFSSYPH